MTAAVISTSTDAGAAKVTPSLPSGHPPPLRVMAGRLQTEASTSAPACNPAMRLTALSR